MSDAILNFEIKRKLFHLCSLVLPILYLFLSKITMCLLLFIIFAATLYIDIFRNYNNKINYLIEKFFGKFLRREEETGKFTLAGSTYMALGFLISCMFFEKGLAITSWLILILSDSIAAIIGIKCGTKLSNGKSFAGSVAFFLSAFLISIIMYFVIGYSTSFLIIIISSCVTTGVEFYAKVIKINDNLSIPLSYSLSTFLLLYII